MKKLILTVACAFALSGCAGTVPMGAIYSNFKLPLEATDLEGGDLKVGTASCKSFFGMIATGDCSIATAMKAGGLTNIHHIDWDVSNIIGIASYKVSVYGN